MKDKRQEDSDNEKQDSEKEEQLEQNGKKEDKKRVKIKPESVSPTFPCCSTFFSSSQGWKQFFQRHICFLSDLSKTSALYEREGHAVPTPGGCHS